MVQNLQSWFSRNPAYLGFAIAFLAAIWGTAYYLITTEKKNVLAEQEKHATDLSAFYESQVEKILNYADSYTKLMRLQYLEHGEDLEKLANQIKQVPIDPLMASHVTVINEFGKPIFNSAFPIKTKTSAKDRDYFLALKDVDGDPVYISRAHKGRNSGKVIIRLVRRITRADGSFAGVIFTAIEDTQLVAIHRGYNLGPESSVTLVGWDKFIRARSSYGPSGPGQNISKSRIWIEVNKKPQGIYLQTSVVDNITRYYAYRKLDEFPMIGVIGVSITDILDKHADYRNVTILISSLISIVLLILLFFLKRESAANAVIEKANREANAANRAKSEFLAHMSHELRTPLNSIIGFSQVIGLGTLGRETPPKVIEYANHILVSGEHLLEVINDILDISKIEAGEVALVMEPINLQQSINDALRFMLPRADRNSITLTSSLQPQDLMVNGDKRYIRQILLNLLSNAVKYTPADGVVTVKAYVNNKNQPCIEIADTGAGIPEEDLTTIMEPFRQSRANSSIAHEGTGLGLSLVQKLVALHDGDIDIQSTVGLGTKATIILPTSSKL